MAHPLILQNPYFEMLRAERVADFNEARSQGKVPTDALRGGDFRGLDLRELQAQGLDLRGAYFRGADLRGIDFSTSLMDGVSIAQAHISGCYFPAAIEAYEIRLSFDLGTRMRARG